MSESTRAAVESEHHGRAFDHQELLRILIGQRWLLIAVTAIVVGATALFTFTAEPYFQAKLRVLIERGNSQVVSFKEIYDLATANDDYYTTQYRILESRAVAESAFAALPEADRNWFLARPEPLPTFMGLCRIQPVPKSRLVDVVTEHPDPAVAARMADAMVAAYIGDAQQRKNSASSQALTKLTADARELQQKLVEAEKKLQEFRSTNEIVSFNDRQSMAAARLEKLNEELASVERQRNEAEARLKLAQKAVAEASFQQDVPEVLTSQVIVECKRALLDAEQERSSLAQVFKPLHPKMQAIERKLQSVRQSLDNEVRAILRSIETSSSRSAHQEQDVRRRLDEQKKSLLELEGKAVQFQILKDESDNTRRLLDTVLMRLKEVQVMTGDETTNIHRIGQPEVSERAVRPRKVLNLAAALLGGILLACGLAFAIDSTDRSIKAPADATRVLGVPVLGLVPHLSGKTQGRGPNDAETYDPRSMVSEAFRTIRTGLTFSDAGKGMRSLVVTSAVPGEGKSFVSTHLAVSLARDGKRVLLVDADMRRPRLHRAFAVDPEEGFSSVLIGTRTLEELVLPTPQDNLSLLCCGILPPNPVELMGGDRMRTVLDAMLARYDVVVFDSPPAGVVSDACVLATLSDRLLFVVRGFATDRSISRRAIQSLRTVGARIAGLVLNHADGRADRYYGNYGYSYGYQSQYSYAYGRSDQERAEA